MERWTYEGWINGGTDGQIPLLRRRIWKRLIAWPTFPLCWLSQLCKECIWDPLSQMTRLTRQRMKKCNIIMEFLMNGTSICGQWPRGQGISRKIEIDHAISVGCWDISYNLNQIQLLTQDWSHLKVFRQLLQLWPIWLLQLWFVEEWNLSKVVTIVPHIY